MKKIYSLVFAFVFIVSQSVNGQCPTPSGMLAVPVSLNGNCFINIQFAIPNSNVSIYNASGYVAQGTANGSGNVLIAYPCASNPITSIISISTSPGIQICNTAVFTSIVLLPVKLVSFSAKLTDSKSVEINWETAFEINNDKFVIEKSTNGTNFISIGTVNAIGEGLGQKIYSYSDNSFASGSFAFYRLKQVDTDGKETYSKVIYINDQSAADYSLFPNPISNGNTTFSVKGLLTKELTYKNIQITDILGKNIPFKINGLSYIEINPSVPSGIYFVKIKEKTIKLLKN